MAAIGFMVGWIPYKKTFSNGKKNPRSRWESASKWSAIFGGGTFVLYVNYILIKREIKRE